MEESTRDHCKHEDCKYRGTFDNRPACLYILRVGHSRGCSISECDKYIASKGHIESRDEGFKWEE